MTEVLLGTHCALCKEELQDDEGVGVTHKGRIHWMHTRCSRRFAQLKKKRRRRQRGKVRRVRDGRKGRAAQARRPS